MPDPSGLSHSGARHSSFAGSQANYFAKSILVGWDTVPAPATKIRTFQVRLHQFTRIEDGADTDWRIFVNVGGQWRYMSAFYDTDANNGTGIYGINQGNNVCQVDPLLMLFGVACWNFDNSPWTVSIQDGQPIHVAVGGFVARGPEDSGNGLFTCRNWPGGCDDPDFDIIDSPFIDLPFSKDDRIGTYEFDLGGRTIQRPRRSRPTSSAAKSILGRL